MVNVARIWWNEECAHKPTDHIFATVGSKDIICANIGTYFPNEGENDSINHHASSLIGSHEDL